MQCIFLRCLVSTIVSPNSPTTTKKSSRWFSMQRLQFFFAFNLLLLLSWLCVGGCILIEIETSLYFLFFYLVYALIFIPFGDHINLWKKFAHKKFLDFGDTQALKLEYFWLWNAMISVGDWEILQIVFQINLDWFLGGIFIIFQSNVLCNYVWLNATTMRYFE